MSYGYRKLNCSYSDLPVTDPGKDMQPVYRKEFVDGNPVLVVDHWISQKELINSGKPIDIRSLVQRAMRGDPNALGFGSDDDFKEKWNNADFGDGSVFSDVNDLYDSLVALKMNRKAVEDGPVDGTVENIDAQPKEVTSTNES